MQTLTIKVDDSYLDQVLNLLQKIPKNKREIFQHTKIDKEEDAFLTLLKNGPTISAEEAQLLENNIKEGYKSWDIEKF